MARLLTCLGLVGAVMWSAPAAPVPKEKPPVYYFPTTVGTVLVYGDALGKKDWEVRDFVTEVRKVGGVLSVTLSGINGSGVESLCPLKRYEVSGEGVLFAERYSVFVKGPAHRPYWIMRPPGNDWDCELATVGKLFYTATGPERVTVPAGTVEAVRVDINDRATGGTRTQWFAPGVGMVRDAWSGTDIVLKSVIPGAGTLPPEWQVKRLPVDR